MRLESIPFAPVRIAGKAELYIRTVLEKGALTSGGALVKRLEKAILDRTQASLIYPFRTALDVYLLAFRSAGLSAGEYLLAPTMGTEVGCRAGRLLGATPILVDAEPQSWQVDLDLLEEFLMNHTLLDERDELVLKRDRRVIRGILVRHGLGISCDMDRLLFIARRFHLTLLEDASASFGSRWRGKALGTFGHLGVFIPTWGQPSGALGGFVLLGEERDRIRSTIEEYDRSSDMGLQMDELTAAVALANWESQSEKVGLIDRLYNRYTAKLGELEGLTFPLVPEPVEPYAGHFSIRLLEREKLSKKLERAGIGYAKPAMPLHLSLAFQDCLFIQRNGQAERLFREVIRLPLHPDLSEADQDRIIAEVLDVLQAA